MKKSFGTVLLLISLALTSMAGCTEYKVIDGKKISCVGLGAEEKPEYSYHPEVKNIFWGIIGSELFLIPTYYVLTEQWKCPRRINKN